MKYIVAPNGVFDRHVTTDGNVEWDGTHYCPASKLTPAEAAQFGVHPLMLVTTPPFDPITQERTEATPAWVAGVWTQQWAVVALDADTIAANQARAAQELQQSIVTAVQARLDTFAQTRNYDGILSAATYASSTVPKFAAEGQCAVNARDATWATLYTLLAEIQAGTRAVPTGYADIEQLLPALVWPQ